MHREDYWFGFDSCSEFFKLKGEKFSLQTSLLFSESLHFLQQPWGGALVLNQRSGLLTALAGEKVTVTCVCCMIKCIHSCMIFTCINAACVQTAGRSTCTALSAFTDHSPSIHSHFTALLFSCLLCIPFFHFCLSPSVLAFFLFPVLLACNRKSGSLRLSILCQRSLPKNTTIVEFKHTVWHTENDRTDKKKSISVFY